MTKNITDRELRQAAASVRDSLLKSVEEMEAPEHSFSAESETAMLRVAADIPKRQVRKASHIILRKAACVALVFLIGTGSLLTFNEDARAAVYRYFGFGNAPASEYQDIVTFEDFEINSPCGSAEMCIETEMTVSLSEKRIVGIKSVKVYQLGSFINFKSWETKDISWEANVPEDGWIRYSVSGVATFSQKMPISGNTVGEFLEVNENMEFDYTEYFENS